MSSLKAEDELTVEDHFCGMGGSTTGARMVPGVRVVHAANHSKLAIATHSHNYPDIEHSLADIPSMDPRKGPRAAVLITTPECRARSYARGRPKDDPHLFKPGDGLDEKSRSTMDEVTRFAAVNEYRAVVIENVPQTVDWCEPIETGHYRSPTEKPCNCGETFRRWLKDMTNLGYEHRKLFWNSAFFPPTPQSRDRLYIVFWKRGQRVPDLDHHPICWCNHCGALVDGVQTMKPHLPKPPNVAKAWGPHDTAWGRYGQQYFYRCMRCAQRAVPAITPAATAIDWTFPATRIGDRAEPLAVNTMARIARGLEKLVNRPMVVPLDYLTDPESKACRDASANAFQTLHGQHRAGLVVQVAGNLGRLRADGSIDRAAAEKSWPADDPLRTLHGSADRAFVVPMRDGNVPGMADAEPLATVTTRAQHGLVVPMRENAVPRDADGEPMPTATTINSLYALATPRLIVSNMQHGVPAVDTDDPMATVTTGNKLYAVDPWIVPLRRNTKPTRAATEAMPTIVAGGNQHYLATPPAQVVRVGGPERKDRDVADPLPSTLTRETHGIVVANHGSEKTRYQGHARDADSDVLGTQTGGGQHSIVTLRGEGQGHPVEDPMLTCATVEQHTLVGEAVDIMDCTFRMLEPSEIAAGMVLRWTSEGNPYIIHGKRRDQVKQAGNAVTPPPMRRIVIGIRDSLS